MRKMNYKTSFVELVDKVSILEKENEIVESYLGTGNPNSKIIVFGKELGFDEKRIEQFNLEVLSNIEDWNKNINNNIFFDQVKVDLHNPLIPYNGCRQKAGHTWSKYQILSDFIFPESNQNFFMNFYVSEIGHKPSKYSQNQGLSEMRKSLLKENSFFQEFQIVILACGNYLKTKDIEDIFSVDHSESKSIPRNKLEIFRSIDKLVVNTRQLSMDVSRDYLEILASEIRKFIDENTHNRN